MTIPPICVYQLSRDGVQSTRWPRAFEYAAVYHRIYYQLSKFWDNRKYRDNELIIVSTEFLGLDDFVLYLQAGPDNGIFTVQTKRTVNCLNARKHLQ